ncbi:MAG: TIGR00269 family protein [Candidatus Methanomethyliaceae archaeon]|nr:TIGR00269 family protein [Candidatus Methanomethyliaceae archaeon]MDW7971159.1 TIGR00269 family protein [Nitrososphaerota archaeon]
MYCKCGREGFYLRRHSGEILCKRCFTRSIEKTVFKTIRRERLFEPNDRIMIALSGGKDSLTLLYILSKCKYEIFAVTIDEGVSGYREEGISISKSITEKLGIKHYIFTFKEFYGYSLEELYNLALSKGIDLLGCTFCGILRRRLLNSAAIKLGATKVATGHNLDDEAQTVFINLMRGDVSRLMRLGTKPPRHREGFVPRVKPLRYIPEKEIAIYAHLMGFPLYERECPYVRASLRDEVRDLLNQIENRHPGTKFAMVRAADKLSQLLEDRIGEIKYCIKCSSPSSKEVCRACQVLMMLGINFY